MARLYKATVYYVDVNQEYSGIDDFLITLENRIDSTLHVYDQSQSPDFEWEDEIDINQRGCSRSDYDKYFK